VPHGGPSNGRCDHSCKRECSLAHRFGQLDGTVLRVAVPVAESPGLVGRIKPHRCRLIAHN
jgi:hypothetical protein